jgi:superoxide dismutase, Fe-Mn family
MPTLSPRSFPNLAQCDALSQGSLQSHVRLYEGYVQKYNELMEKRDGLLARGPAAAATDLDGLKADISFALGAIKNHELFFDLLGPETAEPHGVLAEAIVKSFHSLPQYLIDLKQSAMQARGWAFTAYDLDHDYLFNYEAGSQNGLPVWNTVPIVALDLYGHAYLYDFGNNRLAYVETVMKSLNWQRVAERFLAAKSRKAAVW